MKTLPMTPASWSYMVKRDAEYFGGSIGQMTISEDMLAISVTSRKGTVLQMVIMFNSEGLFTLVNSVMAGEHKLLSHNGHSFEPHLKHTVFQHVCWG